VLFFAISISYLWGHRLLSSVILSNSQSITEILSFSLVQGLKEKCIDFQAYAKDVRILRAIQAANAFTQAMSISMREQYILDIDQQWISSSADSSLVQEYLLRDASEYLRYFTSKDDVLSEIFLTDQFGCLVATTDKTTDFYQADETWWKDSYNGGAGRVVIGDVEWNDASQEWVIPVSVPVRDKSNAVIGILKASIAVDRYFISLSQMRFGESGHVLILNDKGQVVFYEKSLSGQYQIPEGSEFFKSVSAQKTITIEHSPVYGKGYYVICSPVYLGKLAVQDFRWYVCIEIKKSQMFASLQNFLIGMLILAVTLIMVAILLGLESGRRFAEPVQKLKFAAERIAQGDFNATVRIDTHDEIEVLANTFSRMAQDLQRFTDELNKRNEALELSNRDYQRMTEQLQLVNQELTAVKEELEVKVDHLEQFSKISVGRELRMRQLKDKIAALEEELSRLKGAS